MKAEALQFDVLENKRYPHYQWADNSIEWQTDFSTAPPRRYKAYGEYFRVYEHGMVEIYTKPYGCQSADMYRAGLQDKFGIHFALVGSELAGYKFFTPDRVPVPKQRINASVLLMDDNHQMALYLGGWHRGGTSIRYYAPGARPVGGMPITVSIPHPKDVMALRAKIAPMVALATSYRAMTDVHPWQCNNTWTRHWLEAVHAGETLVKLDPPPEMPFLQNLAASLQDINTFTYEVCCTKEEVPFLYFEKTR